VTDLEQLERSLLEGARRDLAPAANDRLRVQAALLRGEAWWQSAAPRTSGLRRLTQSFRGGMTLGLTLGAIIGGALGYGASRSLGHFRAAEPPRPPAVARSEPAAAAPSEAVSPGVSLGASSATSSAQVAEELPATPETSRVSALHDPAEAPRSNGHAALGPTSRKAPEPSASRVQRSSLAEELSLLSRARRALNRSDAPMALGIVESLDERFPNGVLMEERTATRILCLCELGRRDEAQVHARHFLALHPGSVYAARVRSSCAGGQ
jgi:hypothetical protein